MLYFPIIIVWAICKLKQRQWFVFEISLKLQVHFNVLLPLSTGKVEVRCEGAEKTIVVSPERVLVCG